MRYISYSILSNFPKTNIEGANLCEFCNIVEVESNERICKPCLNKIEETSIIDSASVCSYQNSVAGSQIYSPNNSAVCNQNMYQSNQMM